MDKAAANVGTLPNYEMYSDSSYPTKTIENPYLRTLAQVLFGANIAPHRQNGEDISTSIDRRDRSVALAKLKSKSLLTNPIVERVGLTEKLSPIVGGNMSKAIENLHENLSGANMMGAFKSTSSNDVSDTMDALKNNVYKKAALVEAIKHKIAKDLLEGGKADNMPDSRYPKKELLKGLAHEKEHVKNPQIAKEIAKDHLEETGSYYTKLEKAKID